MSLRINLNSAALTASRNLAGTDSALSKSIERLSSGFKINSAGDDPAGLVISEKLRAQVSGLQQAIQNAGDAVNMVKTTEGALNEVNNLLRSMRDLAVHAANTGANDTAAIAADQSQITNALASINKISSETQFGNKKLLDGSAGIKATITGSSVTAANMNYSSTLAASDTVSVNVTTAAEKATLSSTDFGADDTAAIGATGSFTLTGKGNSVEIDYTATMTVTQLAAAINAKTSTTGVTATLDNSGVIVLTSEDYGSAATISVASAADFTGAGEAASDSGVDVAATVTHTGGLGGNVSDTSWTSGSGCTLKDSLGNSIALTSAAASTVADLGAQFTTVSGSLQFQVGAYADQTRTVNIAASDTASLGAGAVSGMTLADVDVTSSATNALKIIDQAISDISTIRANLGATQKNVFESSINSLTVAKENIAASESTIRDTDMAAEMVNFTKYQILNQAGVAMLAQANQAPQNLLSLLR